MNQLEIGRLKQFIKDGNNNIEIMGVVHKGESTFIGFNSKIDCFTLEICRGVVMRVIGTINLNTLSDISMYVKSSCLQK